LPSGQANRLGDEIATIAQSCTRIHDGTFTSSSFCVSLIPVVWTNRGAPCWAATGPVAGGGGPHPAVEAHPVTSPSAAPAISPKPNRAIAPEFIRPLFVGTDLFGRDLYLLQLLFLKRDNLRRQPAPVDWRRVLVPVVQSPPETSGRRGTA
jgi:hypothetical protein